MSNCGPVPFSIICAVVEEAQVHDSVRYAKFSLFCFKTKARPRQMKGVHVHCVWDLDSTVWVEGRTPPLWSSWIKPHWTRSCAAFNSPSVVGKTQRYSQLLCYSDLSPNISEPNHLGLPINKENWVNMETVSRKLQQRGWEHKGQIRLLRISNPGLASWWPQHASAAPFHKKLGT